MKSGFFSIGSKNLSFGHYQKIIFSPVRANFSALDRPILAFQSCPEVSGINKN